MAAATANLAAKPPATTVPPSSFPLTTIHVPTPLLRFTISEIAHYSPIQPLPDLQPWATISPSQKMQICTSDAFRELLQQHTIHFAPVTKQHLHHHATSVSQQPSRWRREESSTKFLNHCNYGTSITSLLQRQITNQSCTFDLLSYRNREHTTAFSIITLCRRVIPTAPQQSQPRTIADSRQLHLLTHRERI
ncbi:hypothetical protein DEO72_LG6g1264 [Vigna unguiculata]|uniref:Uncharacterized protein n=1 Tax=Vigna unguiculata TaxID=3917 RepID=A0A4D6M7M1_VIGUN|nr:hypothetical protein DEO72_LG6g1264 [Vigna unguiculata]